MNRRSLKRSCLVHPRIWVPERLEDGVGVFDGAESLIWYSLTFNSAPQLLEHIYECHLPVFGTAQVYPVYQASIHLLGLRVSEKLAAGSIRDEISRSLYAL
jgi:hypothetical protein